MFNFFFKSRKEESKSVILVSVSERLKKEKDCNQHERNSQALFLGRVTKNNREISCKIKAPVTRPPSKNSRSQHNIYAIEQATQHSAW